MDDKICKIIFQILFILLLSIKFSVEQTTDDPWYGSSIGDLADTEIDGQPISGQVYAINQSSLQILEFQYDSNLCQRAYFWYSHDWVLSSRGQKLSTFEYKEGPIESYYNVRVIINLPMGVNLKDIQSFGIWCQEKNAKLAYVTIPSTLAVPKSQILEDSLRTMSNNRYSLKTGKLEILDLRTIKIHDFRISPRAPEFYFTVGTGPAKSSTNSVKVGIRGHDQPNQTVRSFKFKAPQARDLILDLPEKFDVNNIEWVGIWSDKVFSEFGSFSVKNVTDSIPPYLAPPYSSLEPRAKPGWKAWPPTVLLFNKQHSELAFKLGPPGGESGFFNWWYPNTPYRLVFYVNDVLAPELQLEADVEYTFKIETGNDVKGEFHPVYITDDPLGGRQKVFGSKEEIFAGPRVNDDALNYAGKLCFYDARKGVKPENFPNFTTFAKFLLLKCDDGPAGFFKWTPTKDLIGKKLYYQSFTTSNMGGKIKVLEKVVFSTDAESTTTKTRKTTKGKKGYASVMSCNFFLSTFLVCGSVLLNSLRTFSF